MCYREDRGWKGVRGFWVRSGARLVENSEQSDSGIQHGLVGSSAYVAYNVDQKKSLDDDDDLFRSLMLRRFFLHAPTQGACGLAARAVLPRLAAGHTILAADVKSVKRREKQKKKGSGARLTAVVL